MNTNVIPRFATIDKRRIGLRIRQVLLLIVPALATVAVIWKFFLGVSVPFRLDYAEGFVFTNTLGALDGQSLYHPIVTDPYIFGFYTPLYNYIGAFFMQIFGSDIAVLRAMTFAFFIGVVACGAYTVKTFTKSLFAPLIGALLISSAFIIAQWSGVARPDMLGLFLTALGIAIVSHPEQSGKTRFLIAALIFSLAFFSKQSFIFAPVALLIFLLMSRPALAWLFASSYAVLTGLGILFLHIQTDGEFTKQVFVFAGEVPYGNLSAALRISVITVISAAPLIGIAAWRLLKKTKSLIAVYLVCSTFSFFMLLRDGSIQNYLMEFIYALVLLAVISVPWSAVFASKLRLYIPMAIFVQLFFVLWSFSALPNDTAQYLHERQRAFDHEVSIIDHASAILSEDPMVSHAAGKPIAIDPYTFGQVNDAHMISSATLFADMQQGRYDFVVDYGAFNRISGIQSVINTYFRPAELIQMAQPVKPFDYSLYNRNTISHIGTIYQFSHQ